VSASPLSAEYANSILATCPNLIYIYDLNNYANVYANREIAAVLGYSVQEIQEMGDQLFILLTYPDDLPTIMAHQAQIRAAKDGDVNELEYRMKHKDGTWRWLVSRDIVFARGDDGSVSQYLGIVHDITEKRHSLDWAQRALQLIPMVVYVYDFAEGRNIYANNQIGTVLGYNADEIQAFGNTFLETLMHPDDWLTMPGIMQQIATASDDDMIEMTYRMRSKAGAWVWLQDNVRVFSRNPDGSVRHTLGATQDITARLNEEGERLELQQQVIAAQQAALRELSTPLIPVSDDVVVMPLIGSIDSQRAQLVLETLLEGVAENHASAVILDITGVQVVDTQVANAILRAAQAVKLLGAQVIITGIRPEVAQTLVTLGADLSSIITRSTLQSGIAYALR
jgi:rsbT co-antagonist protein RsbR